MGCDRLPKLMVAFVCASLLSACATTDSKTGSTVNLLDMSYKDAATIPVDNDIRTILAAGGLDVRDPQSPTPTTEASEIASSEKVSDVETLVASLGQTPAPAVTPPVAKPEVAPAAATPPRSARTQVAETDPASSQAPVAMAFAAPKVEEDTAAQVIQLPDIGAAADTVPSEEPHPSVELAVQQPAAAPRRPAPAPVSRASSETEYATPSIRRF